jgi:peptide-methionine (S)-S-oxide reductase
MRSHRIILFVAVVLAVAYVWLNGGFAPVLARFSASAAPRVAAAAAQTAKATFAAGCFWCVEADFDKVRGVLSTTSGYTGGRSRNPTYEQVSRGGTGHVEVVEIVFDPAVVSYEQLLDHYWKNVDPFAANRQFCDVGDQYRPEIFVHDAAQRSAAEASKKRLQARVGQPVVVAITDAQPFYRAEEYHQDYYEKNSLQYRYYRWRCGRDARLEQIAKMGT